MSTHSAADVRRALDSSGGILRLAPTWVPRSFLMPGKRIKLHPSDIYAYGAASRRHRRALVCLHHAGRQRKPHAGRRPQLCRRRRQEDLHAARRRRTRRRGASSASRCGTSTSAGRSTRSSSTTWARSRITCTRTTSRPRWSARKASPSPTTSRPSSTPSATTSRTRSSASRPGTTKEDIVRCLERWNEGDNGILDLSKAYRLKPGTGWLVPPCVLHAPGSLVTYEPQWGSDVFGMYQSLVEGRAVPWALLVKDSRRRSTTTSTTWSMQLDWEANVDPSFKETTTSSRFVADARRRLDVDRWIVYGKVDGEQLFSAKELTVEARRKVTIKDHGAYGI